jgi:hypothetical protein
MESSLSARTQEPIKAMLSGGNPRSLGRTEEVVTLVLGNGMRLHELYDCLLQDDEIVRMRASDALEKVCRQRPEWFQHMFHSYYAKIENSL